MLETKAVFRRKDTEIEATDCVVDKVIHLSGAEFDLFSHNLMREWDFIRDNPIDTIVDKEGRYHCLLVMGEGRRDGILVNSEGGAYARYSALLPNAQALYATDRYPCLTERTQQLVAAADYVVSLASEKDAPKKYSVRFHTLSEKFGISFDPYDSQTNIFMAMLSDRPEIELVRCNSEEFLIDVAPPETTLGGERDCETDALDFTVQEFAAWKCQVNNSEGAWREDTRYRQHKDGALYYIGGENGQYMWIANDGNLTVGTYELARPGIEDAVLLSRAIQQYESYEQAFLKASRLAGQHFMVDIFHEKPSVMEQIREARKAPPAPHKPKDGRGSQEPEL